METYKAVITEGEDGWLIATVPDLPGVVTQAKSMEELEHNIKEAIEAYLESLDKHGEPHPKPKMRVIEIAVR